MAGSLVLSVPREYVLDIYKDSSVIYNPSELKKWYKLLLKHSQFNNREEMEATTEFRQIVACCLIYNENRVLCLRRSAKSGRKAIKLKFTLLIGGHVDEADQDQADPIMSCAVREVREELGLNMSVKPKLLGIVGDPRNSVGMLHLAVIFGCYYHKSTIKLRSSFDVEEFTSSSVRSEIAFWDPYKIKQFSSLFDPWSSLVLKSGIIESITGSSMPLVDQQELPLRWHT